MTADFPSYLQARSALDAAWTDPDGWARQAGLNIARVAHFSSDRTIAEYAHDIWGVKPVPVAP